jgi:hypothetical protein
LSVDTAATSPRPDHAVASVESAASPTTAPASPELPGECPELRAGDSGGVAGGRGRHGRGLRRARLHHLRGGGLTGPQPQHPHDPGGAFADGLHGVDDLRRADDADAEGDERRPRHIHRLRDSREQIGARVQRRQQLVADVLPDVPQNHRDPLQRVSGCGGGPAELPLHFVKDYLLSLEGVPRLHERLNLRALLRGRN